MTEKYIMSENYIPDGILHDQDLYNISLENNELTLSFETHFYPQDYTDTSFAEKYKDFTKCHIKCTLGDEMFCYVLLETAIDKKNNYKGKYLSVEEFVKIANKEIRKRKEKGYWPWEYLCTGTCPNSNSASIELHIWIKYKRVIYSSCRLVLDTKEIKYIWE
ncbi:MAG: hypothetical protein J1E81_09300 [Eubacterium sp.]|nr:hypothetical protein [Eubacterium sp.]